SEGQTEAAPLDAAAERIVRPVKRLENFAFTTRRNTKPTVQHAEADEATVEVGVQLDLLAIGAVFLGIGKQVHEDLSQRVFVAHDGIRRRRGLPMGRKPTLAQMQFVP